MSRGIKPKGCNIDLGLAVSALSMEYGQGRTCQELADFCGCSPVNIHYYERSGLRKLRAALHRKDPILMELMESMGDFSPDTDSPESYQYSGVTPDPVYLLN